MFPLGYSDALPFQWSKQSFAFFYYFCYLEETKPIFLFSQSCHRSTLSDQESDYCSYPPSLSQFTASTLHSRSTAWKLWSQNTRMDLKHSGVTVQHLNRSQQYPARYTSTHDKLSQLKYCNTASSTLKSPMQTQRLPHASQISSSQSYFPSHQNDYTYNLNSQTIFLNTQRLQMCFDKHEINGTKKRNPLGFGGVF